MLLGRGRASGGHASHQSGLDVDVCHAIAAAALGDAAKVRFTPLSAQRRFAALQSGEIDVLTRNTTINFVRDVSLGFEFPAVNYYDGTAFIVGKRSSGALATIVWKRASSSGDTSGRASRSDGRPVNAATRSSKLDLGKWKFVIRASTARNS